MRKALLIVALLSSGAYASTTQIIMGAGNGPILNGSTKYAILTSVLGAGWNTSENSRQISMPVAGTWSNLRIKLNTAPGAGTSIAFTLRGNASAGPITCTISDANTTCFDLIHTSFTNLADLMVIEAVPTGATASTFASFSLEFKPNTKNRFIVASNIQQNTGATTYSPMVGGLAAQTNENLGMGIIPPAGTFANMYVCDTAAPGVGKSWTYVFRSSKSNSTITCTVSDTNTCCSDIVHSSTTVAGELVSISATPSGTPAAANAIFGISFTPANDGEYPIFFSQTAGPSASANNYAPLTAANQSWGTTDTLGVANYVANPTPGVFIKDMYVNVVTAPGAAKSYTLTVRQNGASPTGGQTVALSGAAALTGTSTGRVSLSVGDLIGIESVPSGTPTAWGGGRVGFTGFMASPSGIMGVGL